MQVHFMSYTDMHCSKMKRRYHNKVVMLFIWHSLCHPSIYGKQLIHNQIETVQTHQAEDIIPYNKAETL
jgi:hypothetical protein